jgi:uncharacterized membrane protein
MNRSDTSPGPIPVRAAAAGSSDFRDLTVDVLRGLAILMMVAANLAASGLEEPHPFWFRLYGSFAAPLFVLLAGMMVAYTTRRKQYAVKHFVARGAIVIALAALLELIIWRFYPFMSVDVLYLIGVSLPLARLAMQLDSRVRWGLIAVIFVLTPFLQDALGYSDYPTEVSIAQRPSEIEVDATSVFNHWLLDGWFPLFPWLAFPLLGVQLAELRVREGLTTGNWRRRALRAGVFLLASGALVWWLYPGDLMTRGGYSELFYPPTPGFILTAVGVAVVLLAMIDWNPGLAMFRPLRVLGEFSLPLYLLHIVLIKYLVAPWWPEETLDNFAVLYAGMMLGLLAVAYAGRGLRAKWRHPPLPVRVLLGS